MNLPQRDYAIRLGVAAILDFDSSDIIENFPLQTDQNEGLMPWVAPNLFASSIPEPARTYKTLDGRERPDGFYQWTWEFAILTREMLEYWRDNFPDNSTVTVRAYDIEDTAIYLTALIHLPRWADLTMDGAVYSNVKLRFDRGVMVT